MSFDASTHTFLNLCATKNVPMQHQQTLVVSTFSPQPATCDIARHLTSSRVTANCLFKKAVLEGISLFSFHSVSLMNNVEQDF